MSIKSSRFEFVHVKGPTDYVSNLSNVKNVRFKLKLNQTKSIYCNFIRLLFFGGDGGGHFPMSNLPYKNLFFIDFK